MNKHIMRIDGREYKAEVKDLTPDRATVLVDGKEYKVDLIRLGRKQASDVPRPSPAAAPAPVLSSAPPPPAARPSHATVGGKGEGAVVAPMPGLVLSIKVKEGDTVHAGQVLLVMEAMKMENAITASYNGTVSKVYVREQDSINEGDVLVDVARPSMTSL
jgi:biotin carboxyl carrier protein